ncbi:DUF4919 domain-containing protein [Niabella hibiscisoli]|uniref:DUF4919 domain-containing protein n=1 Tax=Niabella hibiscisoli TaxID=1825928 RepID=UPI001F0F10A4|nr:DUF4919 domain-containing protein [Niabella hibiscisoli]MCH5721389.1 DUF4919 domain-containing protein [Niabella hibiscisoli]
MLDTSSPTGYKALLKKFNETPQYLYPNEGAIVYYGKLFQKGHDAFQNLFAKKPLEALAKDRKFAEMIPVGEALLKTNATDLKVLILLLASYIETKKETEIQLTKAKLQLLLKSVTLNGIGTTDTSTLKVTSIEDEYMLMDMLGLIGKSRTSKSKSNSVIDRWVVTRKDNPKEAAFL